MTPCWSNPTSAASPMRIGRRLAQGTPEGDPAKFLLQVRLDEPSLGDPWQGRLIVVFLVFDAEQAVRSYAAPCIDKYIPLGQPPRHVSDCGPCGCLRKVVRMEDCRCCLTGSVTTSRDHRCRWTVQPATLPGSWPNPSTECLRLRPRCPQHRLRRRRSPMLIQNPHDPVCDECGKPMRFLFQFGEVVPGVQMADDGVCYVYGCDDHPTRCKALWTRIRRCGPSSWQPSHSDLHGIGLGKADGRASAADSLSSRVYDKD